MTDSRVPDLSAVQSPPRRNIDYRTIKEGDRIGSGGQAIVRRSDLPGTEAPQTVAVKQPLQPPETIDPQITESFFEEAETWKRLDTIERQKQTGRESEHIVGVVDIGDDLPWIAMEYMDGGSLKERLTDNPDGLPVEWALWIGECLCRGLKVAHDYGVAHLDLKPANVLFRKTQGETWDVPKIADWGLARVLLNHSGSMDAFSVEYAAPEQFDSDEFGDPDKYTDIYQLGAVVYELLTGDPPYTGGHASVMHDVLDDEDPVPPGTHRDILPEAVDDAVLTALSQNKSDRFHGEVKRFEEALHTIRRSQTDPTPSGRITRGTPSSTQADSSATSATHKSEHTDTDSPTSTHSPGDLNRTDPERSVLEDVDEKELLGLLKTLCQEKGRPVSGKEIAKHTDRGRQSVYDELDRLKKDDLVEYKSGWHSGYKPTEMKHKNGLLALLENLCQEKDRPVPGKEIARHTDRGRQSVYDELDRLKKDGVVEYVSGDHSGYRPTL